MHDPAFWWRRAGVRAHLLTPLGIIYGAVAARRLTQRGKRAGVPVLCVGNFTLGGTGKTPTAIMLCRMLTGAGERPYCLTRGHGGTIAGPKLVDAHVDIAAQVGDEPLLLARSAPTVVARDRAAGAAFARERGATVVVMDDGLQNPALIKDFAVAVVDVRRGIGNARVFPAGPLRAPLVAQIARTDALLLVGGGMDRDDVAAQLLRSGDRPIFHARLVPEPAAASALKGRQVLAFAGIGDPDKFFRTADEAGIVVAERRAFSDHYRFSAEDAGELIMHAEHAGLTLLTTEKDLVRMHGEPVLHALAERAHTLPVTMVVEEADELRRFVMSRLHR